jgi:F-type H+-transporting ATPase subunit a
MESQIAFAALLNRLFGPFVTAIMRAVHIEPYDPLHPITNAFSMEIAVFLLLLLFFILVRASLNVEKPGSIQQIAEMIHGFVSDQADSVIGHGSQRYVVFVTCILIFILLCNTIGLIPGLVTPTAKATVPLGLALLTFAYYHYQGIREQGVLGHAKHFMGPIWWIAWLMVPIEIISHLARVLSLTARLYANMFAGEMVTLVAFSLIPAILPVAFLGLHVAVALLQAYIFMLLAMIYLAEAVGHQH